MKREAPWKTLAAELAAEGVESRYRERLKQRVDLEQELADLEREIASEMARALGRTEEQMLIELVRLELCGAKLEKLRAANAAVHEIDTAVSAFNAQRVLAEKRRRDLVIHREAVGFRRNQIIYDMHPLPARER